MGFIGSSFNPHQRFGEGYDPVSGSMSLGGGKMDTPWLDKMPPAKPKFFGEGGTGRTMAGYLGDALLQLSGGKPVYGPLMAQRANDQRDLDRQMRLARFKVDNRDPTSLMQNAEAAGYAPGSPEYRRFVRDNVNRPQMFVLGNAENGQQIVNSSGPSEPPAAAVQRLQANPAEAAQFDEIFGPGASSRYLNGGMR